MKRVIWLKPEDMIQWDLFVESHPFGSVYNLSAWKEVLEKSFKHIKGQFLALWDEETNEILAGLPLYTVKSWLTGNRLVSIPFATMSDPLISSPEDMEVLLPHILDFYKRTGASYFELKTFHSPSLVQSLKFGVSRFYKHHYLPMDRNPEELRKSFHASCVRRQISKALKNPVELKLGESETDLLSFYQLFSRTRKRLSLPPVPYRFFKSMWEVFGLTNYLTVLLVVHEGQSIAAMLILKFKERATVEYVGDNEKFRHMSPNQLLYWEAIKLVYEEGYRIFSFGRTSHNNKGLMTFKERWGTKMVDLPEFFFPQSECEKAIEKESSWKYQLIKKISEKAPEPLFQMIGNFCYRHIG